ncbi:hypothetical protein [Pandoraea apista]|uniref:hypothetical protein n=1 Tax=Pandoraea apista TaxID=93218 RepID=UPI000658BCC2|nr:hypothetical protein [Pandoraea apista]ALS68381.1 hypothetical protein AT395_24865 [Pandoraea apista]CFB60473.1 hypothetical protein LMG16407_00512 [Pandoraea apista]
MSIFDNEAATGILREAAQKLKALGLHTDISVSSLPQGDALALIVSDSSEGAEANTVALTEGGSIAHSDGVHFAKEIEFARTTRLANRLAYLHHELEDKGDRGTDWSLARALEDRLGSGQPIPGDEEDAKRLLAKYDR